jgi:hypothetical protein
MAYAFPGAGALDYFPCRYGRSKLLFRGPQRRLDAPYCAAIGGTETYGKFVAEPYPVLVERQIGLRMVNLGCVNAGPDVFLNEPAVFDVVAGAEICVVQVMGALNLSNRFYAVHPRRNDRFLRAAPELQALFPDIDFTEFHFTRHLLRTLRLTGAARFDAVAEELREVWVARMAELLRSLPGKVILLWLSDHAPVRAGRPSERLRDPVLVNAEMIASVRHLVSDYVEVVYSPTATAGEQAGIAFAPTDRLAAAEVPGPAAHADVAAALAPILLPHA